MKVTTTKATNKMERRLLEAAILSYDFLKAYSHIHRPDLIKIPYGAWLLDMCVEHANQYKSAPGAEAVNDAARKATKNGAMSKGDRELLSDLLKDLPPVDYKFNTRYLVKRTAEYLGLEAYRKLKKQLEVAIDSGDVALCEQALTELRRVRIMSGQRINPFTNKERVMEAFTKDEEPLFKLPGALGKMLNPQLKSGRFLAFIARAKTGKTALLYKIAVIAKRNNLNVAVFACGDEDEDSSIIRFGSIITHKNSEKEFCGTFAFPIIDCEHNQNGICRLPERRSKGCIDIAEEDWNKLTPEELIDKEPSYKPCSVCRKKYNGNFRPAVWYKEKKVEELTWGVAWKRFQSFHKLTKGKSLELFTYSSDTLTVSEVNRALDVIEDNEGWIPDVVICDYPDLQKDESGEKEFRHKENQKWKAWRRLTQDRNVLAIAATQSNRSGGVGKESLDEENANEDRRKLDHVTGLYAINQTRDEKKHRIARIGPVVVRRGRFDIDHQVVLLQRLEEGQLWCDSFFSWHEAKKEGKKKD